MLRCLHLFAHSISDDLLRCSKEPCETNFGVNSSEHATIPSATKRHFPRRWTKQLWWMLQFLELLDLHVLSDQPLIRYGNGICCFLHMVADEKRYRTQAMRVLAHTFGKGGVYGERWPYMPPQLAADFIECCCFRLSNSSAWKYY